MQPATTVKKRRDQQCVTPLNEAHEAIGTPRFPYLLLSTNKQRAKENIMKNSTPYFMERVSALLIITILLVFSVYMVLA